MTAQPGLKVLVLLLAFGLKGSTDILNNDNHNKMSLKQRLANKATGLWNPYHTIKKGYWKLGFQIAEVIIQVLFYISPSEYAVFSIAKQQSLPYRVNP